MCAGSLLFRNNWWFHSEALITCLVFDLFVFSEFIFMVVNATVAFKLRHINMHKHQMHGMKCL